MGSSVGVQRGKQNVTIGKMQLSAKCNYKQKQLSAKAGQQQRGGGAKTTISKIGRITNNCGTSSHSEVINLKCLTPC